MSDPSIPTDPDAVNDFLARWHRRPMFRLLLASEDALAMTSTRALVERFIDHTVVECRLVPTQPSEKESSDGN